MSVAARISRLALVATIAATAVLSVAGASSPVPALAAGSTTSTANPTANQRPNQRALIVRLAESHVGAHYRFGAEGRSGKFFDCSGLVFRVFMDAGLIDKIGGNRKGAKGYLRWFRERGLASKTDPKPGDLVIWNNGHHIGIYVGNGMAVSALNKRYGVREHPIGFVHTFTTYLHVQISGRIPAQGNGGGGLPSTVKVTADHAVVRDGPGQAHSRVGNLVRGKSVPVIDKATDASGRTWFKVKLANGVIGWVLGGRVATS